MKKNKNMSTLGFILSAIGAAVGLGNIWRFPTYLMNYGGPAFLIPYLIAVLCLGLPLLILEINLGHKWRKAPTLFYGEYFGKSHGRAFAWLQAGVQLSIGTFYAIIISWVVISGVSALGIFDGYNLQAMTKSDFFNNKITLNDTVGNNILGSFSWIVFGGFVFIVLLTALIVGGGLTGGIERVNKLMVPLLFCIIVGFFVYSLTFENAGVGIRIIFQPDFAKLSNAKAWSSAFSQALFTLSLAVSIIVIYSASAPEKGDNTLRAITIMSGDTLIALLACVIVGATLGYGLGTDANGESRLFVSALTIKSETKDAAMKVSTTTETYMLENGLVDWTNIKTPLEKSAELNDSLTITFTESVAYNDSVAGIKGVTIGEHKPEVKSFAGGGALIFRVLPVTFHRISGRTLDQEANALGKALSTIFFVAVFFAAMSSMISLYEPTVSNLAQGYGIRRLYGVLIASGLTFIFGFWFAFSGSDNVWDKVSDFYVNELLLISALTELALVGFFWKKLKPILDHNNKNSAFKLGRWFQYLLVVSFLLTMAIFVYGIIGFVQSVPLADKEHVAFYWGVGSVNYLIPLLLLVIGLGYFWKGMKKKGVKVNV